MLLRQTKDCLYHQHTIATAIHFLCFSSSATRTTLFASLLSRSGIQYSGGNIIFLWILRPLFRVTVQLFWYPSIALPDKDSPFLWRPTQGRGSRGEGAGLSKGRRDCLLGFETVEEPHNVVYAMTVQIS